MECNSEDFYKQVYKACSFGKTEQEMHVLEDTYKRWNKILSTVTNCKGPSPLHGSHIVSPGDIFQCLSSVVGDIHKLLTCEIVTVSQCLDIASSDHFSLMDKNIACSNEIKLPPLKQRLQYRSAVTFQSSEKGVKGFIDSKILFTLNSIKWNYGPNVVMLCRVVPMSGVTGYAGNLFVCDGTGQIPCLIPTTLTKDCLNLLQQWVLLTSWNLILNQGKDKNYVEICQVPVPLHPAPKIQNLSVLSSRDAKFILKNKDQLKVDYINIVSEVTAVSEVFRVKTDVLFCIQLSGNMYIIVKKKEFLHWHSLIIPPEEYVFLNLKPTTLKKGTDEMIKIFVPWKDSRVIPKCKTECLTITLKHFLASKGISASLVQELYQNEDAGSYDNEKPGQGQGSTLCNYQGIITSNLHAKLGIYTLDHKIGLYVCCIPAVTRFNTLRVGAKIIVYNAHMKSSSKVPKLKIMCCLSSSVRVVECSPLDSKPVLFDPSSALQQLFWKHGLSKSDLDSITNIHHSLITKMYPTYIRNIEPVLKIIIQLKFPFGIPDKHLQRNFLNEFMTEDEHLCCLNRKDEYLKILEEIPELKDIANFEANKNLHVDVLSRSLSTHCKIGENKDGNYWVYNTKDVTSGQVLVGQLKLCPSTGHIQLCDRTGYIDCVIAEEHNSHTDHRCGDHCHVVNHGSELKCPWVYPTLIGSVIAVYKFIVVQETFTNHTQQSNHFQTDLSHSDIKNTKTYIYIQFSMKNVILVKDSSQDLILRNKPGQKRKKSSDNKTAECSHSSSAVRDTTSHEQIFFIQHVESLIFDGKRSDGKLRFSAVGYILKKEDLTSDNGHGIISSMLSDNTSQNGTASGESNEMDMDNDNCIGKPNNSDLNRIDQERKRLCRELRETTQCDNQDGGFTTQNIELPPAQTLLFQGNAVQWYNLIIPGRIFRVISPDKEIISHQIRVTSWHLKKASKKAGGQACIVLPENISCERIIALSTCSKASHCYFCSGCEPFVSSVADVMSENFSDVFASFIGQITSRKHVKPEFQGRKGLENASLKLGTRTVAVSTPENRAIQLQVQCIKSMKVIEVYMNLENSSYPLGLLPGAVVHFYKLERKTSHTRKVYCQYISVSCVRVIKFTLGKRFELQSDEQEATMTQKSSDRISLDNAPYKFLADLWGCHGDAINVFRCVCHVQKVLKITLKCVCQICGTVVVQNRCGSTLCQDSTENRFVARASLIVEDGTSVAIVTCTDQNLQNVLQISKEEWDNLQECVASYGEIFMQQMNQTEFSGLEKFVCMLCENFEIKRQLVMYLSPQSGPRSGDSKTSLIFDFDNMMLGDFVFKTVDTGLSAFETRCLPFLQLECHGIQELDCSEWTLHNLTNDV